MDVDSKEGRLHGRSDVPHMIALYQRQCSFESMLAQNQERDALPQIAYCPKMAELLTVWPR